MGAHGPNFTGIHHFGFEVEDLDEACDKLEGAHGQRLIGEGRCRCDDGRPAATPISR